MSVGPVRVGPQTDPASTIAVLADDLTSAGDGAAPFRRTGHRAQVLLAAELAADGFSDWTADGTADGIAYGNVVAVDLGSRLLDEPAAAIRTERAARRFAGADLLVKTVDSTLRGHLAAEIRAAHAGSRRQAVVVAPAFPAEGRTTIRGVQYVEGVPVHETDFARDPAHPVRSSDLARLLPEAELLEPDGFGKLPELIDGGGVFVCSAATDADLDLLISSVPRAGDVLWVGSPGLAAALARHHSRTPAAAPPELPGARRPLVVVGSAHPATRRQLDRLRTRADVDAADAADDPAAAVDALRRSPALTLAVHTPDARRASPGSLTSDLAVAVRELAATGAVDGLVLTGGETAVAVLEALGATGIDLFDEPEPGVARGVLLSPPRIPVLIKAGGFGDEGALDRLCRLLVRGAGTGADS
ncbi:four-carbon acid sugar kinase family protein [Streptomyces vilmorinianum]|uniref:four-carbon acid sugar kinase family protein n=1 Tax=Streptomyces vilmorinianum TaxID=3051092 RepID=UPI0010FB1F3F|nr:four-carbon acid sugar kinase family protein [Streptomyces vilmorinianum]